MYCGPRLPGLMGAAVQWHSPDPGTPGTVFLAGEMGPGLAEGAGTGRAGLGAGRGEGCGAGTGLGPGSSLVFLTGSAGLRVSRGRLATLTACWESSGVRLGTSLSATGLNDFFAFCCRGESCEDCEPAESRLRLVTLAMTGVPGTTTLSTVSVISL